MRTAGEILREQAIQLADTAAGRHYTTCPRCSAKRLRTHQANKVLGVTIDGNGVQWGCNHCSWTGGAYYDAKRNGKANGHAQSNIVATYDYVDENGEMLFQVCRKANKGGFPQRRPDGKGGWIWGTKDVRKVLYRLPELTEAIAAGHAILIVEGEKDADAAWRLGLPATCNPGGASEPNKKTKWRKEYSETLRGADVTIIPDHDEPGYAHANAVARELAGIAGRVQILKLAEHWREVAAKNGGDLSDGLDAGHAREELDALIRGINVARENPTAKSIKAMKFDPIKYVVPGIIVEGLTLLAAKPKAKKSWLMLHAAIAVARSGFTLGDIKCEEGDVLYCALEDNLRRLKSRLAKLLSMDVDWPERLTFKTELPRLATGGIEEIENWIKSANNPRLIVIDTLAMVRSPKKPNETPYDADYASVEALRKLANQYGVAFVVIHHLRKADSDDAFDTISGTLGLTGAVDTLLVLKRDTSGNVVLHGRGRDVIEFEKALVWNEDSCTWTVTGSASEARMSRDRRAILAVLGDGEATPSEIAAMASLKPASVKHIVLRMVRDGLLARTDKGKYAIAGKAGGDVSGDVDGDAVTFQ